MIGRRHLLISGSAALATTALLPRRGRSQTIADVIVIGAGLSGLNAAHLLHEAGAKVVVLEGRNRAGGRLYTLDEVPGHPEAGGSGIAGGYARVLDWAERMGLARIPARARTEPVAELTMMNLDGENIALDAWPSHPRNPFPEDKRKLLPWNFQFGIFRDFNPLPDAESWLDPAYASYDVSVHQFLSEKGFSDAAIGLGSGTNPSYGTTEHDLSVLMWFNILAWGKEQAAFGGGSYAIDGGNQRLPDAMARAFAPGIRYDTLVAGIRVEPDGVDVRLRDGETLRARHVISTLPFTALRLFPIDPAPPAIQAAAIDLLGYAKAFQVHYVAERPFWEADGLPPSMWTNGIPGRFMALRNDPANPKAITSFIAFVNGPNCDLLDRMPPDDAARLIADEVARMRPAAKGALTPVKTWSWQRDPFAGGIYASWAPGQISRFANAMAAPHGRLHFAGEHTGRLNRGMEAAMESGERAAFEVLEQL